MQNENKTQARVDGERLSASDRIYRVEGSESQFHRLRGTGESRKICVEMGAKMGENNGVGSPAALTADDHYHDTADRSSNAMATPTPKGTTSPAFQFYPKDFLTSPKVRKMSLTERGAYITLLSLCWLDGSLPDDENELASELHVPVAQFRRMWAGVLSQCFTSKNGRLTNDRLDEERRKQLEYRRRQSDYGKKGGRPNTKGNPLKEVKGSERVAFVAPSDLEKGSQSFPSPIPSPSSSATPKKNVQEEDGTLTFNAFRDAYPAHRRKDNYRLRTVFVDEAEKAGGAAALMAALANHKASEQWQTPKLVPGMDTWLDNGYWRQSLDPPGASPVVAETKSKWEASLPPWAQKARAAKAVQS